MTRTIPEKVQQRLANLPESPGCYLMKDKKGKVIYVGKAVVLRNRVRSYFHSSAQHSPKTLAMVGEVQDIAWWVTETELEALMLENELIKQHWPRYNIRLKDDKTFPYIRVRWQDDFPRVEVVRKMIKDGSRYFGPYTSGRASYTTLDALRRIFPYLDCNREITGKDARPCLYYHIKLCGGPCIGVQNKAEYRATIQQLMDFLHGDADRVVKQLEEQMERAAENLQFELAALYRDRRKAAELIAEQQKIVSTVTEDVDYIALAHDERTGDSAVQVFIVRHGRLIGREHFMLEGVDTGGTTEGNAETSAPVDASALSLPVSAPPAIANQEEELSKIATIAITSKNDEADTQPARERSVLSPLLTAFLQQFYDSATFTPRLLLVQTMPDNIELLERWLASKAGGKVELRVPQRGHKLQLMQMAMTNAAEYLRLQQAEWAADTNRQTGAIYELQEALSLNQPPARIECYDISTLQGTHTVGSMVVFAKGSPLKSAYRKFKITGKGGQGAPDDFASMREMLRRRFRRAIEGGEEEVVPAEGNQEGKEAEKQGGKGTAKEGENWKILPDLVIIDGGKGQLGVAVEVLEEYGLLDRIPIVGLAKREEEIFFPNKPTPLWLKRGSQALHLVQRVRDEAHRFGVTFHRSLRRKAQIRSKLDDVPGIGPTKRKALLTFFAGDVDRIRHATVEELLAVPGMNRKLAETVKAHL